MAGRRRAGGRRGGLGLRPLGGGDFELDHPRCVAERELDYVEGIELWKAGDPESARDALRYALDGCGDNLWVHVALGRIALEDAHDPALARGHLGYAVELGQRALPQHFQGRLPRGRTANRPFFDALDGLAACYEALGQPAEAAGVRTLAARLDGRGGAAAGRAGDHPGDPRPGRRTSPRDPPESTP
jgi:tetratricopeptide (TPR) repeat protein